MTIEPDRPRLLARHWHTLRDLLWLATATVVALGTLTFLVIDRALRPAGKLVAALDQIAASESGNGVEAAMPALNHGNSARSPPASIAFQPACGNSRPPATN